MSEFDDWHSETDSLCPRRAFDAGQQSQQAKINDSENTRAVLYRENIDIREKNIDLQAKIDELKAMVDEALIEMKNQLGDEDFCDMQRPDYDAMLYALRNIKDILIK